MRIQFSLFGCELARSAKHNISSNQFLTYAKIRTHVSPHQNLLKTDDKTSRPNTSLQSTIQLPRGHSSREHRHSETSSLSWARWLLQPTLLIFAYIYRVSYTASTSHVSNIATTPKLTWTIIKSSRNRSRHQGHNPSRSRRIVMCISYSYWIRMTRTVNKASRVYIHWKKRKEEKRQTIRNPQKLRLPFH